MKQVIDGLLLSFSYFTVLPIFKKELSINKMTYSSMLFFFPFTGLIIISISIYFALFTSHFVAPLYAIVVSAILYLCLYGFLHLEAVADVIDAWVAKYSNKDVYAIMKEPHIGSIGAIGVFCFILLKLVVLIYLMIDEKFLIIVSGIILSRLSIIYCLKWFDFHEQSFFAQSLKTATSYGLIFLAVAFYLVLLIYFVNVKDILILLLVSIISSFLVLSMLKKRFGFLNGDCMGTTIELTELFLLNVGLLL